MDAVVNAINTNVPKSEAEYIGEDGLLHCSVCHRNTQTEVDVLGNKKVVRCICDCRKKELDSFRDMQKAAERQRRRNDCFAETIMVGWTFAKDDRKNAKLSDVMQNYVNNFTEFKHDGKGLLLHGTVGTGKTFLAACVANALIEQGLDVRFRTFKQIEREHWNAKDKEKYIRFLNRCDLLIFDDLGVERDSKYMMDIVFDVVDTRYKSGLPFIVTTNLTIDDIKKPLEVGHARIYDRILERCFPVEVSGKSRRRQNVKDTFFDVKEKLGL